MEREKLIKILNIQDSKHDGIINVFNKKINDCILKKRKKAQSFNWAQFKINKNGLLEEPMPYNYQKILVSDGIDVWEAIFFKSDDGKYHLDSCMYFEQIIGLYWTPFPEPPKEANNVNE